MTILSKLLVIVCVVLATSVSTPATIVVDYDGSVAPNANNPALSFVVFGGTTFSTDGNALTLTTTVRQGIWFGYGNNIPGVNPAGFSISPNTSGSYLSLHTKFSDQASEWSMYIYDGVSSAFFDFNHDSFRYVSADEDQEIFMDLTDDFHHFELELKDGLVNYRVDGVTYAFGHNALASNAAPLIVVGDGSGSSISGTGSMIIDNFIYNDEAGNIIPEPTTAALLLMGSLALVGRRSHA